MGIISKSDLHYKDYVWTAYKGDDPKICGEPDSSLLSRKEGYEILYFINKLCDIYNLKNVTSATKIERMIREKLPSDTRSQEKIKMWIKKNWDVYKF